MTDGVVLLTASGVSIEWIMRDARVTQVVVLSVAAIRRQARLAVLAADLNRLGVASVMSEQGGKAYDRETKKLRDA